MDPDSVHNRSARSPSNTSNATAKSDVTDFVKYLLEGSGAEDKVDFAALRRELEGSSAILSQSNLLDEISYSTSPATKKFYKDAKTSTRVFPAIKSDVSALFEDRGSFRESSTQPQRTSRTVRTSLTEPTVETQKRASLAASETSRLHPLASHGQQQDSFHHESSPAMEQQDRAPSPVVAALNAISDRLASSSFPSLHPSLLFAPTTPYSKAGSLSERQIEALAKTIETLLDEYDRRGELVQTLLAKNAESEGKMTALERQLDSLHSSTLSHNQQDTRVMDQLYSSQKDIQEELESTCIQLISSQQAAQVYQSKYEDYKKKNETIQKELNRMQEALESLIEKNEKERMRIEQTFQTVTQQYHRNPNKSGIDRLTLEVIQVYEEKIQELKDEMDQLRSDKKESAAGVAATPMNDDIMIHMEKLFKEKTKAMESELAKLRQSLQKKEEELELLKLQQLHNKVPEWIEKERSKSNGVLKTRDLIHQDKRMYSMKLYALEAMDVHECKDLLKFVCVKLDVKSIQHLTTALDDIEKVVLLIPQMQKFIIKVDQLVWSGRVISPAPHKVSQGPPHKLSETLELLEQKMQESHQAHDNHILAQSIHRLLKTENNVSCIEKIEHLLQATSPTNDTETAQAVLLMQSFCSLFDTIPAKSLHKVKQLYIQHASTQAGLEKLKTALRDEALDVADPANIIVKATECIEQTHLDKAIQQSQGTSPTRSLPSPKRSTHSQKWSLDDSVMQEHELNVKKSNSATSPRRLTFQDEL